VIVTGRRHGGGLSHMYVGYYARFFARLLWIDDVYYGVCV